MSVYEQKLDDFARAKTFRRLSNPIRDRADTFCDACGSNLPRILYGLKEKQSGRYFFVGANCLTELLKRCSVQRRYLKESGRTVYDTEMERRAQDYSITDPPKGDSIVQGGVDKALPLPTSAEAYYATPNQRPFIPTVVIQEANGHYRVFVSFVSDHGDWASGYVERKVDNKVSHIPLNGGVLLERTPAISSPDLADSISRAWEQAKSQFERIQLDPNSSAWTEKEISQSPLSFEAPQAH